jgi:diguanylate cyclase (GGDEF)-like protein
MRLIGRVHALRPALVVGSAVLALLAVSAVDLLVGANYSFSIFYLLIVLVVAATGRSRYAFGAAIAAAVSWGVVDVTQSSYPRPLLSLLWNTTARFAVLYVCAVLVTAVVVTAQADRQLSRTCALTGVFNRRGFLETAQHDIEVTRRSGATLSVAYFDVDGFKAVNDTRGHAAGDQLLQDIALAVCRQLRRSDVVARVGGDEFAVLLPDTRGEAAEVVGERLRRGLDEMSAEQDWPVRYSVGVATFPGVPGSVEELLAAGDRLMYRAKQDGRRTGRSTVVTAVVAPAPPLETAG